MYSLMTPTPHILHSILVVVYIVHGLRYSSVHHTLINGQPQPKWLVKLTTPKYTCMQDMWYMQAPHHGVDITD